MVFLSEYNDVFDHATFNISTNVHLLVFIALDMEWLLLTKVIEQLEYGFNKVHDLLIRFKSFHVK